MTWAAIAAMSAEELAEQGIQLLQAGVAAPGAVQSSAQLVSGNKSGVHISPCHVQYPRELPEDKCEYKQVLHKDVIVFKAEGTHLVGWDNVIAVGVTGYISNDSSPPLGRMDSEHKDIPLNRFLSLDFGQSGHSENMSAGLLECNIEPWGGNGCLAEGTNDDPWVALRVQGQLDPVGIGDMNYEFKMRINTLGVVALDWWEFKGTHGHGERRIDLSGDHVFVYLP